MKAFEEGNFQVGDPQKQAQQGIPFPTVHGIPVHKKPLAGK
jgi:hypothetical protein